VITAALLYDAEHWKTVHVFTSSVFEKFSAKDGQRKRFVKNLHSPTNPTEIDVSLDKKK
jgi:hypothetical protein